MSIVFGTGHRLENGGFRFSQMLELAKLGIQTHERPVDVIVCGMASGWDLALGLTAIQKSIPVWSVKPWAGHRPRRDEERVYREIEELAERHVVMDPREDYPGPQVYHIRNHWMTNNSHEGLAFWDGRVSGGTYACIKYARQVGRPVRNLYPRLVRFCV